MKSFVVYLKEYVRGSSRTALVLTLLFVAVLITCNYTFGIERRIRDIRPWPLSLLSFFFFYGFVCFFAWGIQYGFRPKKDGGKEGVGGKAAAGVTRRDAGGKKAGVGAGGIRPGLRDAGGIGRHMRDARVTGRKTHKRRFLLFLLAGPLFFSFKMIHWDLSVLIPAGWHYPWDRYTQIVLQLPAKLLLLWLMLWGCRKTEGWNKTSFYGLTTENFRAEPYFMILLLLTPLIALASTQPDFLHTYPKLKNIAFIDRYASPVWPWKLLYELSYGLDFLSIELFFRGFLVIGLARYAGKYAILPMAVFYCTIHFGKPMGECISSLFGGLALGVIAWRTRSILGGLIVHLGLAWLMELGGFLGNL